MAKTLVTYYSRTGNTQKVAEAIYETLDGDRTLTPIEEIQAIEAYNLVFVGFPVHSHSVPYRVEEFLKKVPPNKKVALFCTHGSLTGGRLSREAIEYATILAAKAKILGTFSCRGRVSLEALTALSKSPEHVAWTEMAASASTHPDASDLEDARSFARVVKTLSTHSQY
jgi:flavodoxin